MLESKVGEHGLTTFHHGLVCIGSSTRVVVLAILLPPVKCLFKGSARVIFLEHPVSHEITNLTGWIGVVGQERLKVTLKEEVQARLQVLGHCLSFLDVLGRIELLPLLSRKVLEMPLSKEVVNLAEGCLFLFELDHGFVVGYCIRFPPSQGFLSFLTLLLKTLGLLLEAFRSS